ncbi:uncharacterized protein F4812DRAFT_454035 [Daldinia caldariorum]|uniref:uncharacterized protein n=1 Tax=Daldinia caldariorum TaxID=326644 RepID=UPI002008D0CB|nr:uncharacterized protein F4812DRAFT_454035 [Daldinia caldariorum]KAI1472227.1 hypothetical protein F4812DRAFT_454035 [Daldinia caldariorum]
MKENDVIAIIIILLFIVLALIAFGIYRLVQMARVQGTVSEESIFAQRTEHLNLAAKTLSGRRRKQVLGSNQQLYAGRPWPVELGQHHIVIVIYTHIYYGIYDLNVHKRRNGVFGITGAVYASYWGSGMQVFDMSGNVYCVGFCLAG